MDFQSGNQAVNQGQAGSGNVSQLPEDSIAPADRETNDLEPSFPARVNVTVEKPSNGALLIQTVVQDGLFQIEEVSYFSKPDLAYAQTAEKDWARQSLYAGPPFENLDEDLQTFLERYLEERGINAELGNMIPDYIQVKEQKEYVRWLESKLSILVSIPKHFSSDQSLQVSRTSSPLEGRVLKYSEIATRSIISSLRVTSNSTWAELLKYYINHLCGISSLTFCHCEELRS